MIKYINAEKLRKLLANRYEEITVPVLTDEGGLESFYRRSEIHNILKIVDSLQQEQPEVDLENEISTWIPAHIRGGDDGVWNTKNAVIEWAGIVAHHFYELGKNSKK